VLPPSLPARCRRRRRVAALPAIAELLPPPARCHRQRHAAANAAVAFVFIVVIVAIIVAVSVTVAAAAFSWLLFVLAPAIAVATGVFVATATSGGSAATAAVAAKLPPTADIAGGVSGIRTLPRSLINLLGGITGKTDPNWDSPYGSGPHLKTDLIVITRVFFFGILPSQYQNIISTAAVFGRIGVGLWTKDRNPSWQSYPESYPTKLLRLRASISTVIRQDWGKIWGRIWGRMSGETPRMTPILILPRTLP
jgi:hypothetical protein